jgi:hypothetical protein
MSGPSRSNLAGAGLSSLSTHAGTVDTVASADTSTPQASSARPSRGLLRLEWLDLVLLPFALPIFLVAGLPLLGWGVATVAWLSQRAIQVALARRANASDDVRTVAGLMAASMLARGWLLALAILGAGLIEREAGLSAAVLAILLFTVYFTAQIFVRPFAAGGAR